MTSSPAAQPIQAYGAARSEGDEPRRRELLDIAWGHDAVDRNPLAAVTGRDALSAHLAETQASLQGGAFFRWAINDATGTVVMTGWDVGQLDDHGRIARLTGFLDADTGSPRPRRRAACARGLRAQPWAGGPRPSEPTRATHN